MLIVQITTQPVELLITIKQSASIPGIPDFSAYLQVMGIIQRQSIKNSILNYLGAGIGAISTFLVYPLAIEVHGMLNFLKVTAMLCIPLANLGVQTLVVRFFPQFKDPENDHNGFLVFLLLVTAVLFLIFLIILQFFGPEISDYYLMQREKSDSSLIPTYLWYVIPLTFLLIIINILIAYTSNFHRIVVPALLYDFLMKVVGPSLILLYYFHYVQLDLLVNIYLFTHVIVVGLLLFYLARLGELRIVWPSRAVWQSWRPMASYAVYSLLGSLGAVLATQLDTFMVGTLKTDFDTGVYANSILITAAIAIPQRAIFGITAPLIATYWQNNDLENIKETYQKASINLLLVGAILFLLLNTNLQDLCALVPQENAAKILAGQMVIFLIGLSIVIDMATSINGHIIYYSKYYRVSFYMILILGLLNIGLNLYFIPKFGIAGAATSTLISLLGYNIAKVGYVYFRMGIQPFTRKTFQLLGIIAITSALAYFIPETPYPLLNLFYRIGLTISIYAFLIYRFTISPDANRTVDQTWAKIRSIFSS